jgi:hypothetical protein
MRRGGKSAMFMELAKLYSELSKVKSDCGNFQKAWNTIVDYVYFKLKKQGVPITYNLECKTNL